MAAASHRSLLHAAFLVSTDSGPRVQDEEEDLSLLYSYPANAPSGSTGSFVKSFSPLIVTVRGAMDSICGEKAKLVYLDHGDGRLLLASAHLESVVLVVALKAVVPPSAATSLAVQLAETLVLLMGPFAAWGLGRGGGSGEDSQQQDETKAILDRIFDGVLSQINSSAWGARMAPWNSFESSCLHLALPYQLHQRLSSLVSEHVAQRYRAPFSFFRKHSCLMYRGLLLASDMHPLHARQLWQLLWALGVLENSGGLPCQVLTRIVHLPQPAADTAAAAAGSASGTRPAASLAGSAVAAAAAALQAEAGVTVSEQPMGRSLLVVVSALKLVLAVVLTAYDEEIEEELAGRLEGHSAAELLQRIHMNLGPDLERLVEGSVVYGAAARALEPPPPPPVADPPPRPTGPPKPAHPGGSGGSLLFRAITRNRSTPRRAAASAATAGTPPPPAYATSASATELPYTPYSLRAPPANPSGATLLRSAASAMLPPPSGYPQTAQTPPPRGGATGSPAATTTPGPVATPPGALGPDRSFRGLQAATPMAPGNAPGGAPAGAAIPPVPAPEGVMFLIAHDVPQGCVRFLGDLPSGAALSAVWRAVAACRARFGLHNVAVAAPPKHARLTMTLDQIQQLSAARSQKSGGQRLGTADSSPWQYHPELASLAAVNTITLRLPGVLASGQRGGAGGPGASPAAVPAVEGGAAAGAWAPGGRGPSGEGSAAAGVTGSPPPPAPQQQQQQGLVTPPAKSWLSRLSGGRHGSRSGSPDGSGSVGPGGGVSVAATSTSSMTTPFSATPGMSDGPFTSQGGTPPAIPPDAAAALYLTAVLFPDTREVYMCHTADLDETKLVEAMWEGTAGGELWVRESMAVAS